MNESINQFRILGIVCKPCGACVDREYVTVWKICNPILFRDPLPTKIVKTSRIGHPWFIIRTNAYIQNHFHSMPSRPFVKEKKKETVKLQFEKSWKFCK